MAFENRDEIEGIIGPEIVMIMVANHQGNGN